MIHLLLRNLNVLLLSVKTELTNNEIRQLVFDLFNGVN